MFQKIIFFTVVSAAVLAVVLLAVVSPYAHKKHQPTSWFALSLYVQPSNPPDSQKQAPLQPSEAFIFRHKLTEGPKNTSRVIGKAQGFVLPVEHLALTAFNIIYLALDTPEYSGSLSIEAKQQEHGSGEELVVVGGTGSFAFARGAAVIVLRAGQPTDGDHAMYHVKLRLGFPSQLCTIQSLCRP